MDPFSIFVATFGIADVTITRITDLQELIHGVIKADEEVQTITTGLAAILRPLALLRDFCALNEAKSSAIIANLKETNLAESVNFCGDVCGRFSKDLKRWTKHSTGERLSLRDRFVVGLFRKKQIQSLKEQVQECQSLVHLAVSTSHLLKSDCFEQSLNIKHEQTVKELRMLETQVQEHAELVKVQQDNIHLSKQELDFDSEDEAIDSLDQNAAMMELERLSKALEANRTCSERILRSVRSALADQVISNVSTSQDSVAWIGMPENVVGRLNQRINNIATDGKSTSYVGVWESRR